MYLFAYQRIIYRIFEYWNRMDELCWHTGIKLKVNADLKLTYNPSMEVKDILEMKNNPEISTKIKIF